jgi:DNA-directed RNA polymerase specialized sigma24 family protein
MVEQLTTPHDFSSLGTDELFALARASNVAVYERALPLAEKVARAYCKRYKWICPDDLTQDLMYEIPRIMYRYREDNAAGNSWSKYLYHRLHFLAKDVLRKEDPLGISFPQKREYPSWHRLGDESLDGFDPIDIRETIEDVEVVLKDEIHLWRDYFDSLPPMRKSKRDRLWDDKLRRVKFRRHQSGLAKWLKKRRTPKQLSLSMSGD